jgi:hypothetical protein
MTGTRSPGGSTALSTIEQEQSFTGAVAQRARCRSWPCKYLRSPLLLHTGALTLGVYPMIGVSDGLVSRFQRPASGH